MSRRNQFLLLVAPCLINCVALFFVAFGAAFGGPQGRLLWPALVLFVVGVLVLSLISAVRATRIGHSPVLAFLSVVLASSLGPAVFVPLAYLAFKPDVPPNARPASAPGTWLPALALLVLPWAILVFFGLGRNS